MNEHHDLSITWNDTVVTTSPLDLSGRPFFSTFGIWQIDIPLGARKEGLSRVVLQFDGSGLPCGACS